jgi:hypothetical protein
MIRLKTLNWISYVNKETRGLRKLDNWENCRYCFWNIIYVLLLRYIWEY